MSTREEAQKVWNRRYKIMWVASIILAIYPIINPIGLPTPVSPPVRDYYTYLEELPEGSVVAVSFGASAQLLDEQEAQFLATWKILFSNNLKVVFYSSTEDSTVILDRHLGSAVVPEDYGYEYGVDYVRLGFSPLQESGQAALSENIRSVYPNDYYGDNLDTISLMQEVNSASDIDVLIHVYTSCTDIEWSIRQWVTAHHTPVLAATLGCCGPMAAPYYPTQIQGFLSGSSAGTQLEVISGFPGPGAAMSDASNLAILPFFVAIIHTNYLYFVKKRKEDGN